MSTIYELKQQLKPLAAQTRALCDLAMSEDREFTKSEQETVDAHLKAGEELQREIERLEADPAERKRAKRAQEKALAKQIIDKFGGSLDGGTWAGTGAGRIGGGAKWSTDFLKALPYQPRIGRKALLPPSGSVTVGTMLPTVGELSDTQRITSLLALIPRENTSDDNVSYLRETERTHAAQPVGIGDKKAQSTYTLERVDDKVHTIAHLSEPIPRNWLADAPMLNQFLNGVLSEGLTLELEAQILQGTGLVEDFTGIINTAGVQGVSFTTDILITARMAITALEVLPVAPDAWVMHPQDWETFELTTDGQGQYQLDTAGATPPVDRAARRLWGLPVALSVGCPQGTGIVAAWRTAPHLWLREDTRIDWSEAFLRETDAYEAVTGFESNMVQFRAELRAAFGVPRPQAICLVDLLASS